jgi:CubicO group peptidase (beta-lactamase class C family)
MRNRLAFVLAATLATSAAFAADPLPRAKPETVGMSSPALARIGETIEADVQNGKLPGAVVAVARKGKLVYYRAFGYQDKDAGTKMTTDSIFAIASMTKPIVALAALTLNERGQMNFDDPVGKYLPQFGKQQVAVLRANDGGAGGDRGYDLVAAARQPNIMDLMRHTSGMIYGGRGATPVHKMYPASSNSAGQTLTGEEFLNQLAAAPLLQQPGSTWDYSFGLDVLGLAIERVSGKTLGRYVEERIFHPLGMSDTTFVVPADKAQRIAKAL